MMYSCPLVFPIENYTQGLPPAVLCFLAKPHSNRAEDITSIFEHLGKRYINPMYYFYKMYSKFQSLGSL